MIRTLLSTALAILLAACGEQRAPEAPPATSPDAASTTKSARAVLKPTMANAAAGELSLTSMGTGVHIRGELTGLAINSEHGFHVHDKGDCSAPDAGSAGGHFNPGGQPHGDPRGSAHHAGDLINVRADEQGRAQVDVHTEAATLGDGGANDIAGKAIIVHAKPDDYSSQPSGNSGDRIACGVIE
jgi:Cu-Zn family superoxide dismutase